MHQSNRREFLRSFSQILVLANASGVAATPALAEPSRQAQKKSEWMARWMTSARASDSQLYLGRFRDETYFLTQPITWRPNPDQSDRFDSVQVPSGFVTDLASIPRIFFLLLRPDGEYAYAAIIHDYLYWTQGRPREAADEILRMAMEDFEIDRKTIFAIYQAVRLGGAKAWNANGRLRAAGEKRILKDFPTNARIRWSEWKRRPDVFAAD